MKKDGSGVPVNMSRMFAGDLAALGKRVIELKRHLEDVARRWQGLDEAERKAAAKAGVAPVLNETTGQHVYALSPDWFVFGVLGVQKWLHATYQGEEKFLTAVDPWIVCGGLRKLSWLACTKSELQAMAPLLDADTRVGGTRLGSTTTWLDPLPVLFAKEGKNRIHMYQNFGMELLTTAERGKFLPSKALRLYRSPWNSDVWALRYVGGLDSEWEARMQHRVRRIGDVAVLPFPKVGVPLLTAHGVARDRGWGPAWRFSAAAQKKESTEVRAAGWS